MSDVTYRFFLIWRHISQWTRASILSRIRSNTQTHHTRWDSSGRVISSSQRPLADNTQHSERQTSMPPGGIRTHDPSKRAAADLRLSPRGQRGPTLLSIRHDLKWVISPRQVHHCSIYFHVTIYKLLVTNIASFFQFRIFEYKPLFPTSQTVPFPLTFHDKMVYVKRLVLNSFLYALHNPTTYTSQAFDTTGQFVPLAKFTTLML